MTQLRTRNRIIGKSLRTKGHTYVPYLADLKSKKEPYEKESKLAKAYEVALDTRKFEIELYWKRATYFWAIAAVVLGAIGLLVANAMKDGRLNTYPILLMLEILSCVGFIVTKAWQYVNLGGKFWQLNWELHVDILEQEVLFPLFRTVITECRPGTKDKQAEKGNQTTISEKQKDKNLMVVFSPSKVNEYLGRFLNTIFIVIGAMTFALILWKAGLAEKIGLPDVKQFVRETKAWLIPVGALVPLVYTLYFWMKMAGNARTTTLKEHLLNVTQREINIREQLQLPDEKRRGLWVGVLHVLSELNPVKNIAK